VSQFQPVVTPKERCEECGFVYAEVSPSDAAEKLRSFGRRYRAPMTRFLAGEDGDTMLREPYVPDFAALFRRCREAQDAG